MADCKSDCSGWDTSTCVAKDPNDCGSMSWVDSETGYMWSNKTKMKWYGVISYCNSLSEDGCSDWTSPTISELKTLIQNCPTKNDSYCTVNDSCLTTGCATNACAIGCTESLDGKYSKLGDIEFLFSASAVVGADYSWGVNFNNASVVYESQDHSWFVRCIRK